MVLSYERNISSTSRRRSAREPPVPTALADPARLAGDAQKRKRLEPIVTDCLRRDINDRSGMETRRTRIYLERRRLAERLRRYDSYSEKSLGGMLTPRLVCYLPGGNGWTVMRLVWLCSNQLTRLIMSWREHCRITTRLQLVALVHRSRLPQPRSRQVLASLFGPPPQLDYPRRWRRNRIEAKWRPRDSLVQAFDIKIGQIVRILSRGFHFRADSRVAQEGQPTSSS